MENKKLKKFREKKHWGKNRKTQTERGKTEKKEKSIKNKEIKEKMKILQKVIN